MNPTTLLVVLIFAAILFSLGSALVHMVRGRGDSSKRTARMLTIRISLSIALFVLLFVLYGMGLIRPHGLNAATLPDAPAAAPMKGAADR